ncbi:MAG: GtrA family protein [Anaerolineae bacterium]|nr:GtrA family protein [Anaerolineae bacterium]
MSIPTSQVNPIDRIIKRVARQFGDHSKEVERFLRFAIVGTIGFVVDFGTLNLLQLTVLVPQQPDKQAKIMLAAAISFCAAVTSNFFWNRYWTYPDSRSRSLRRQLAQFFLINTLGLVFRTLFVGATAVAFGEFGATLVENMNLSSPERHQVVATQLGTNIAAAISVVIVMFWNFFANRYWTYNDVD